MSRISLELVPRTREGLDREIDRVRRRFPRLDTLNLPDLERFPVRSWEACSIASLDPYRDRARDVLQDIAEKREAGATGFFTQPFFDLRFMEIWSDQLDGCDVYWGLSPVTRVASRR